MARGAGANGLPPPATPPPPVRAPRSRGATPLFSGSRSRRRKKSPDEGRARRLGKGFREGASARMAKDDVANEVDDELEQKLGPVEPIDDELLSSPADVPIVERRRSRHAPAPRATGTTTAATWFFGTMVTVLLALQTWQLLLAPHEPAAPPAAPPADASADGVEAKAAAEAAAQVDRLLYESRTQLHRGVYETAIRLLEPLLEEPALLGQSQRHEAYYLLSQAHRALHHFEKAQAYYLRAIDQSVDRHEPALVLEDASELATQGRFDGARQKLCQLLARRDGLDARDVPFATQAAARVADSWYEQAVASGQIAPLPGATPEPQR
jgi:tetratricopeptide (TPR) repeat protein